MKAFRTFFINILADVLHVANAYPPIFYKSNFYTLKEKLLKRFGETDGFDVQHIVKVCYDCDGLGYHLIGVMNLGEPTTMKKKCIRCADGVYTQFWVELRRYCLGKHLFYSPEKRYYTAPEFELERPMIKGYVEHRRYPCHLSYEAFLWLCLVFDVKFFFSILGRFAVGGRAFTPLVWLSSFIFRVRRFKKFGWISDVYMRILRRWTDFRQSHCRHEFPVGNRDYDECQKCGVSRWQTLPREVLDDEFPF